VCFARNKPKVKFTHSTNHITGNNCIIWHAQTTTAPQDLNTCCPVLSHMHTTQLHLGIWTRIVLYYLTRKKHNCTSGFEHVSSCIISHAQNTTVAQDMNTYRLYYLTCTNHNCTSGFEQVLSCIISHAQNTFAPRDLNTYRPVLSHMQETQQHLRIWTRVVLYYLTCTKHNCTSGFEHVSSCTISHARNTTASQDLDTCRPVLSHMQRTQLNLRSWTLVILQVA
jgi:predicted metalloprotease with PDZ domain